MIVNGWMLIASLIVGTLFVISGIVGLISGASGIGPGISIGVGLLLIIPPWSLLSDALRNGDTIRWFSR